MTANSGWPGGPPAPHSRIRHCPVCGIAMLASKTREDLADYDLFQCLSCDSTISQSKPPAGSDSG